jgi:hypothetical protein
LDPVIFADPYDPNAAQIKRRVYKQAGTIQICPTLEGGVPTRVLANWFGMMTPMNQPFVRLWPTNYEVGAAYSQTLDGILANEGLAAFPYVLTLEHDNMPPPDGLLTLIQAMEDHPEFAAIGGLYWTKGYGGQPMIYGDTSDPVLNFRPLPPVPGELVECNGLGMGFTLFRMELFKDERLERPLFETVQTHQPGVGSRAYTQDLHFFERAKKLGYRFACHCGVTVGHYDKNTDTVW